jgi:hypothetical protein
MPHGVNKKTIENQVEIQVKSDYRLIEGEK